VIQIAWLLLFGWRKYRQFSQLNHVHLHFPQSSLRHRGRQPKEKP